MNEKKTALGLREQTNDGEECKIHIGSKRG
jgi:hypothetical protein